jgi:hypothetical protein
MLQARSCTLAEGSPAATAKDGLRGGHQRSEGRAPSKEGGWQLGVVACGEVLAAEGVSGDVSKLREWRGGEREVRAASIEEKGVVDGGLTVRRQGRCLCLTKNQ